MINNLTISKFITIFLVSIFALLIMVIQVQGQESAEDIAQKYGITFPIAELGGCTDIDSCRNFCEDPINTTTCINYAKSKGFYEEEDVEKTEILQKAKQVLGCDSYESCQNFCSISTNFDKCDTFAKQQGLSGGHIDDPGKQEILQKAKEILGCDSYSSCTSFCSNDANRNKCSEFAKQTGLRGGERSVGPGGCTSEETCRSFCSDPNNFQVCKGFTQSSGQTFTGPGGCNSEESCRAYCRDNENECRSFAGAGGSPPPGYHPQEMCLRTPNCKWTENTCQCGFYGGEGDSARRAEEYAKFCRENPSKCGPGQTGGFGNETERQNFEDYCRQNPQKCAPTGSWSGSPPSSGTTYTTYTPAPTSYPNATSYSAPSGMSREQQEAGCRSCGGTCTWSGDFCNCQCTTSGSTGSTSTPAPAESTPAPQPEQTSAPQEQPQSSPAPSPTVQGIAIFRSILDRMLDFFR